MAGFLETFGGRQQSDHWTFELAEQFNGGFGGTNGGVLTAISTHVARKTSGRRPASIDSHYLRGFRPGTARLNVTPINEGRTLSTWQVDILDDGERLCTRSIVTTVEQSALADQLADAEPLAPPEGLASWAEGKLWREPPNQPIPLIETFRPSAVGGQDQETVTATRVIWSEADTAAEAACIAADISVGPPVARAVRGQAMIPNPNLSLRFCTQAQAGRELAASCRLSALSAGLAATDIRVWSGRELIAIGASCTTCLPIPGRG